MPENLPGILIIGGGIALILFTLSKRAGATVIQNQTGQASLSNLKKI
mgnify:CR=1 FL=1